MKKVFPQKDHGTLKTRVMAAENNDYATNQA